MRGIANHSTYSTKFRNNDCLKMTGDLLDDEETAERERRLWPPKQGGESTGSVLCPTSIKNLPKKKTTALLRGLRRLTPSLVPNESKLKTRKSLRMTSSDDVFNFGELHVTRSTRRLTQRVRKEGNTHPGNAELLLPGLAAVFIKNVKRNGRMFYQVSGPYFIQEDAAPRRQDNESRVLITRNSATSMRRRIPLLVPLSFSQLLSHFSVSSCLTDTKTS